MQFCLTVIRFMMSVGEIVFTRTTVEDSRSSANAFEIPNKDLIDN